MRPRPARPGRSLKTAAAAAAPGAPRLVGIGRTSPGTPGAPTLKPPGAVDGGDAGGDLASIEEGDLFPSIGLRDLDRRSEEEWFSEESLRWKFGEKGRW